MQESRDVNQLIRLAYLFIKEYDETETVSGEDLKLGLDSINLIIDGFSDASVYIPYLGTISFNLQAGKNEYTVSNVITADITNNRIVLIDYCNIIISQVVYPVIPINRSQVYPNTFSVESLFRPVFVLLENQVTFSTLKFFPKPDQAYACEARVRFFLDKFTLFSQITNVPLPAQDFLTLALARRLKSYFGSAFWDETAESEYQRLFNLYRTAGDIDLQARSSSLMRRPFWGYYGTYFPLNVV